MLENPAAEAWLGPQWVVDCALGTPVLLLGGALLWRRPSFLAQGLLSGAQTEPAVIATHLLIGGVSFALFAFFLRSASPAHTGTVMPAATDLSEDPRASRRRSEGRPETR